MTIKLTWYDNQDCHTESHTSIIIVIPNYIDCHTELIGLSYKLNQIVIQAHSDCHTSFMIVIQAQIDLVKRN